MYFNSKKLILLPGPYILFILASCILFFLFLPSISYAATYEEVATEFATLKNQLQARELNPKGFLTAVLLKYDEYDKNIDRTNNDLLKLRNESIKSGLDSVGMDANSLLDEIFYMNFVNDPDKLALQKKLVNLALEVGADPNHLLKPNNLTQAGYLRGLKPEILELLFNNKYKKLNPDLFCQYMSFMKSFGYMDGLCDAPASLMDKKYKNLSAKAGSSPRIPKILHRIWVTNKKPGEEAGTEICAEDIENIIQTKNLFSQEWEHIVWTNDKSLIPVSVKKLESNGIQVRAISEIEDHLKFGKKIIEIIERKAWRGVAIDILKYDLVYNFGGVAADMNFVFIRDIEKEVHTFDFFNDTQTEFFMENYFFAAKAKHPILEVVLSLIDRNINNPPEYIAAIDNTDAEDLALTVTTNPLTYAYYKAANNDTIDVIYPTRGCKIDWFKGGVCIGGDINVIKKYVDCDSEFFFPQYRDRYVEGHDICGADDLEYGNKVRHYFNSWVDKK